MVQAFVTHNVVQKCNGKVSSLHNVQARSKILIKFLIINQGANRQAIAIKKVIIYFILFSTLFTYTLLTLFTYLFIHFSYYCHQKSYYYHLDDGFLGYHMLLGDLICGDA